MYISVSNFLGLWVTVVLLDLVLGSRYTSIRTAEVHERPNIQVKQTQCITPDKAPFFHSKCTDSSLITYHKLHVCAYYILNGG